MRLVSVELSWNSPGTRARYARSLEGRALRAPRANRLVYIDGLVFVSTVLLACCLLISNLQPHIAFRFSPFWSASLGALSLGILVLEFTTVYSFVGCWSWVRSHMYCLS